MPDLFRKLVAQRCNEVFSKSSPNNVIQQCVATEPQKVVLTDKLCLGRLRKIFPKADVNDMLNLQKQMRDANISEENSILLFGQIIAESNGFVNNAEFKYDYDLYHGAYLDRQYIQNSLDKYKTNQDLIGSNNYKLNSLATELADPRLTPKAAKAKRQEKMSLIAKNRSLLSDNSRMACKMKVAMQKLRDEGFVKKASDYENEIATLTSQLTDGSLSANQKDREIKKLGKLRKLKDKASADYNAIQDACQKYDSLKIDEQPTVTCSSLPPSVYLGRGGIQLTHDDNYKSFFEWYEKAHGERLDYKNETDLRKVQGPPYNSAAAVYFFKANVESPVLSARKEKEIAELVKRKLDSYGDLTNEERLFREKVIRASVQVNGINKKTGEPNHLEERIKYTETVKKVLDNKSFCDPCSCGELLYPALS